MDYNALIQSVFDKPETADEFIRELMKKLNDITFNGKAPIGKIMSCGSVALVIPEVKQSGAFAFNMKKTAYWLSLNKTNEVVPD